MATLRESTCPFANGTRINEMRRGRRGTGHAPVKDAKEVPAFAVPIRFKQSFIFHVGPFALSFRDLMALFNERKSNSSQG